MVDIISDIKTPTEYLILCGDVRKNQELVKSDDPKEYRFPDIPGSKWARMRDMLQEKLDNVDTVCEGDTKKVINVIYRAVEELKKLENKNSSQKRRKTNAK